MRNLKTVNYDEMFTLSAPSPKWVWNAQGQLVEVPAGQPAFDHDPVTGEALGLLLENEATNLLEWSEDFTNPYWTKTSVTLASETVDKFPSLFSVAEVAENGNHEITKTGFSVGDTLDYFVWAIVAPGTRNWVYIYDTLNGSRAGRTYFNISTGEIGQVASEVTGVVSKPLGDGYYMIGFTVPSLTPSSTRLIGIGAAYGDGVNSYMGDDSNPAFFLAFMQVTQNNTASSPIRTVGSAVTRAADVAAIENVDTAEWYGASEGAFLIEFGDYAFDTNNSSNFILAGGANQRFFYISGNGQLRSYDGENILNSGVNVSGGGVVRAAVTWADGEIKILATGGSVQSGPYNGIFSSTTSLAVFTLGLLSVNLHQLNASRRFLSDSDMQKFIDTGSL